MKISDKIIGLLGISMTAFLLSGCNIQDSFENWEDTFHSFIETEEVSETYEGTETLESIPIEETAAVDTEEDIQETEEIESSEEAVSDTTSGEKDLEAARENIGLTDENLASLEAEQAGYYYYDLCDETQKVTYVEMYQTLLYQADNIKLTTTDADSLITVYQCVINDHPELFFLNGYTYTKHTINDVIKYITFTGRYLYTADEISARNAEIEASTSDILAQLSLEDNEYEISKAIYEYLIYNTEYGSESEDNQNICSVFLDHVSVCNGYAKAAQYLFEKMNIPCLLVNGEAGDGRHAWNIVLLDGDYYQFDATWGDPSYYDELEGDQQTPDIDYGYLNITTDQITRNHSIDTDYAVPLCVAQTDNYYQKEGLFFSSFDQSAVSQVLQQAEAQGDNEVTIQAADEDVYNNLYEYLITQQNIFQYFKATDSVGNYSVAYTSNDTLFTLSFWK